MLNVFKEVALVRLREARGATVSDDLGLDIHSNDVHDTVTPLQYKPDCLVRLLNHVSLKVFPLHLCKKQSLSVLILH